MKIKDKTILVTGAGSGIGKELVLVLIQKGAKVVAIDIRQEALDNLVKEAGKELVTTFVADISDKKTVSELPKKVGEVDGIINNAGIIQPFVKVNELQEDAIERVMNINFYGTLNMVKAFLPGLLKRPEAHIVNVSSMGGFLPVPGQSVYGASKAAVKLLTEGLYAEMAGTNVKVSIVFPGATQTNISANSGVDIPRQSASEQPKIKMTSAAEAAKIIVEGIEKDKFQIFVGKDCKFMNTLYRFNPRFATNFIAKQMKSLLGNNQL